MRVYLINSVYKHGSTGYICADIKEALQDRGHKCRVAYGRKGNKEEFFFQSSVGILGHMLYSHLTDNHGGFSKKATKKLLKDIEKFNPDIIHLHNIHGYYVNYEILFDFLKTYGKPVVWTLHDCWTFTGHCAHFDAAKCTKWHEQCYQCGLKNAYPKSFWKDRSFQNYVKKKEIFTSIEKLQIITPSKWLADRVKESFLKQYKIRVIYNGIDFKVFYPRDGKKFREKQGISFDEKIILGVASVWSQNKGVQDFIKLSKTLSDEYKIVLIGKVDSSIQLNSDKFLHIEHTANKQELAEIYSAADVYFNASVEETMGLTTVEALACNTPVIVYNRTAIPEVVPEGAGIIIEPGNIENVKFAIEDLLGKKGYNYREKIMQFDKQKQYAEYIEMYDMVLKNES